MIERLTNQQPNLGEQISHTQPQHHHRILLLLISNLERAHPLPQQIQTVLETLDLRGQIFPVLERLPILGPVPRLGVEISNDVRREEVRFADEDESSSESRRGGRSDAGLGLSDEEGLQSFGGGVERFGEHGVSWAEVEVGFEGEHSAEHGVEVEDTPEKKGKKRGKISSRFWTRPRKRDGNRLTRTPSFESERRDLDRTCLGCGTLSA